MSINLLGTSFENVVYIDASLEAATGDGSTAATALNNLPNILADNTCYILRRCDEEHKYRLHPQTATFTNLAFVGMPNASDDVYWSAMAESVKTLWGDDTGQYAALEAYTPDNVTHSISSGNGCSIKSTTMKNFFIHNCYVSRSSGTYKTDNYSYGFNYIFFINNLQANINISSCKFSYYGIDLEKDEWLSNPQIPANNTTYYYGSRANGYLYAKVQSLNIKNTIINWASFVQRDYASLKLNGYTGGCGVHIYVSKLKLENNKFIRSVGNSSSSINPCIYVESANRTNICHNELIKIGGHDTTSKGDGYILEFQNVYRNVMNINYCSYKRRSATYDLLPNSYFIYINNCGGLVFNDNKIDCGVYTSSEFVPLFLKIEILGDGISGLLQPEFKRNKVEGIQEYAGYVSSQYAIVINYIYIQNDNSSEIEFSNSSGYGCKLNNRLIMEDCTISVPFGGAISNIKGLQMKNCTVTGLIKLERSAALDLAKYSNYMPDKSGITISGGKNYIRIRDFYLDKKSANFEYSSTTQITSSPASQNYVYVDKSNCDLNNTNRSSSISDGIAGCYYICPNKGITGHYWQISSSSTCESYNVYRSGSSAQASLRFTNALLNNAAYPLVVGESPLKGFILTPETIGKKNIVVHTAFKNFASNANEMSFPSRFVIEVKVPYVTEDTSETLYKSYFSDIDGYWLDDNDAEWVNDEDLNQRKVIIPINVTTLETGIEVCIHFGMYDSTGIVYLDPDIELNSIS